MGIQGSPIIPTNFATGSVGIKKRESRIFRTLKLAETFNDCRNHTFSSFDLRSFPLFSNIIIIVKI